MQWDMARQRGAGFVLHPLQPAGVYPVMSTLNCGIRFRSARLMRLVATEAAADLPLMGPSDLPRGTKRLLHHLVGMGLVERFPDGAVGARTRYAISALGVGMLWSLAPVARWALEPETETFDRVAASVRRLHDLPVLQGPAPEKLRHSKLATGLVIQMLTPRWSREVLEYIDTAGEDGISPSHLLKWINADAEASSGESRVEWRLSPETAYQVLRHLMSAGLVEKQPVPPRVLYRLTPMGAGLMAALWEVSEWGMAHDAELFRIMATTGWFPHASKN